MVHSACTKPMRDFGAPSTVRCAGTMGIYRTKVSPSPQVSSKRTTESMFRRRLADTRSGTWDAGGAATLSAFSIRGIVRETDTVGEESERVKATEAAARMPWIEVVYCATFAFLSASSTAAMMP